MIEWTKLLRKSLVSAIYSDFVLTAVDSNNFSPDWEAILLEIKNETDIINIDEISDIFENYKDNKDRIIEILKKHANNWEITFDIVKSCLIVLQLEIEYYKNSSAEVPSGVVGKYVRLAQEFAGGDNPGLVHAVGVKLLNGE
jgi:transcription termination factor NusB